MGSPPLSPPERGRRGPAPLSGAAALALLVLLAAPAGLRAAPEEEPGRNKVPAAAPQGAGQGAEPRAEVRGGRAAPACGRERVPRGLEASGLSGGRSEGGRERPGAAREGGAGYGNAAPLSHCQGEPYGVTACARKGCDRRRILQKGGA